MSTAERIYEQVKNLPEPLAREVLDFVGYLRAKLEHGEVLDLMLAQQQSLDEVWDNATDDVWNNV
ncbi:MAG: hypothetical protein ACREVJ_09215 [Gammaproteobacteria bacterium]